MKGLIHKRLQRWRRCGGLLGTVVQRESYQPPWLDKSSATQLALPPLPEQACQRLVQALVPEQALLPSVLHAILSRAEGNPFFVEELTQALLAILRHLWLWLCQ